ncbi:hypothetical protein SLEP1_g52234 [Rubroshorea leprosula]|uniref:Uncharacterized protein n=1 Tax=Rubroshorea leprosula TaxID=152421 RepID=A0AAV5M7Y3_9ROSI|nr:hypothetical protein SLEP1_g52234 [Rubroshorea leprosula]
MNMKQSKAEMESLAARPKQAIPAPPPPPPLLPRSWVGKKVEVSVTNREIAKFWRQKRFEEEDHLFAAIKAAARLRARNFTEEEYGHFEESLNEDDNDTKEKNSVSMDDSRRDKRSNEIRVGIRDWWKKSKYAYLNQPPTESMDPPKRQATAYVPNCFTYKPAPLYPTSLGVF